MVQLTLPDCETVGGLSDEVERVASRWAREFGDGPHLMVAAQATTARFSEWRSRVLARRERDRINAYFGAVARRALMREGGSGARDARRRLLEASIAADLRAGGWDAERAAMEARLVTTGRARGTAA